MKTMSIALALVVLQLGFAAADDNVLCVQRAVSAGGYDPGPLDGQLGTRTLAAAQSAAGASRLALPPLTVGTAGAWCQALQVSPTITGSIAINRSSVSSPRKFGCLIPHYTVDPDDPCF